jgi:hypothetical protein
MKNWKTTASGALAALPQLIGLILPIFGVNVPPEILTATSTLGLFLIGLFAKDRNVTGGTVNQ